MSELQIRIARSEGSHGGLCHSSDWRWQRVGFASCCGVDGNIRLLQLVISSMRLSLGCVG